jgi:pimeloyl-ACP methyl ester carboxylesterase
MGNRLFARFEQRLAPSRARPSRRIQVNPTVDLVGWSYGGLIAQDFALDNPGRVRTLTLIEPPAFWALDRQEENDPDIRHMKELLHSFHGDITVSQLQDFVCGLGDCPSSQVLREDTQWQARVAERQALRGLYAVADHRDDPARLRAFDPLFLW